MKLHGTTAILLPIVIKVSLVICGSDLGIAASQPGKVWPERHDAQACADICAK